MGSRIVVLLLSLASALGAVGPAAAAPAAPASHAVATIVEGESSFVRDAHRFALAEGVRLAPDDLIETDAQTRLLRIEFDDGTMLLVAPDTRLWLAPKFAGDRSGSRNSRFYLMRGTVKLSAKAEAGAVTTPLLDLKSTGRATVIRLVDGAVAVFAEAGDAQLVERSVKGRNGATVGASPFTLKNGQFYVHPDGDKARTATRPDAEFIKKLPRAFLDTLPSRASLFADREVEAQPLGNIEYAEVQPWIDAEAALRPAFLSRWRSLASHGEFRKGLVAGIRNHPEWDRTLFPEKYLPKPASAASGVAATVAR